MRKCSMIASWKDSALQLKIAVINIISKKVRDFNESYLLIQICQLFSSFVSWWFYSFQYFVNKLSNPQVSGFYYLIG